MQRFVRSRMVGWLFVSLVLTLAIGLAAPQQLPVSLYKLSLITSAAWVAYWIDRSLFPYARPDSFLVLPFSPGSPMAESKVIAPEHHLVFCLTQLRRAIIIAAAMIGVALGA